jgi:hypothetical protein
VSDNYSFSQFISGVYLDLGSPLDYNESRLSGWFLDASNIGKLNNLIGTCIYAEKSISSVEMITVAGIPNNTLFPLLTGSNGIYRLDPNRLINGRPVYTGACVVILPGEIECNEIVWMGDSFYIDEPRKWRIRNKYLGITPYSTEGDTPFPPNNAVWTPISTWPFPGSGVTVNVEYSYGYDLMPSVTSEQFAIYKILFEYEYYKNLTRTTAQSAAFGAQDWISLREGDSSITRVNKNELSKNFRGLVGDAKKELDQAVKMYLKYSSQPAQVAGDDTDGTQNYYIRDYNRISYIY